MRILITGATGQVGSALRRVVAGDLICPTRVDFDLSRPESLSAALDQWRPDLILNPAAYTAVDKAEDESELAMRVNGLSPGKIAHWAASHDVPLVHFSTDYVFDGEGEHRWREDDPVAPLSAYGRSKLAGENEVRSAGGAHLVVRTSWVFAAEGANFMRTMIRLAQERSVLRVVADQFGAPTSAHTIADIVNSILLTGASDLPAAFSRAGGLLHVTNSGTTSWHGFASAIIAGMRARGAPLKTEQVVPIESADYPTKAHRPANSRLDLSRLASAYAITPPSWEQALEQELDKAMLSERPAS